MRNGEQLLRKELKRLKNRNRLIQAFFDILLTGLLIFTLYSLVEYTTM
jgi:uncharacterized membrane protein